MFPTYFPMHVPYIHYNTFRVPPPPARSDVQASGMEMLTVYAFSTENWKREQSEIDGIMHIFVNYCKQIKKEVLMFAQSPCKTVQDPTTSLRASSLIQTRSKLGFC